MAAEQGQECHCARQPECRPHATGTARQGRRVGKQVLGMR